MKDRSLIRFFLRKKVFMNTYERIKECRMIPVIALDNVSDAKPLAKALYDGGLPCAEVTFRRKERTFA